MSALTLRNSHGELVDIATVAASKLENKFGAIFEKVALGQPVAITKHDTPKAVLISYEEFASPGLLSACADADPAAGKAPAPKLVLHMERGKIIGPADFSKTPDWAKPIVVAALKLRSR
jgi:prevent-host-death family protein